MLCTRLQHKQMSPSEIWLGFPRCHQLSAQLTRRRVAVTVSAASGAGIRLYWGARCKQWRHILQALVNRGWEIFCISVLHQRRKVKLSHVKKPVLHACSFCFIITTNCCVCHKKRPKNNVNPVDATSPMIHLSQSIISIPFNKRSLMVASPEIKKNEFNFHTKITSSPLIVAIKQSALHTTWQVTHKN